MVKKLIFLMRDFSIGGGERFTVSLMNSLDRSRFEVIVIVLDDTGPFKAELATDIRVISLSDSQGNALQFLPKLIKLSLRLRAIIRKLRPDLVIGTRWFLSLVAALIIHDIHSIKARLFLINHIPVQAIFSRSTRLVAPIKRWITASLFRRADRVIAITDFMRNQLIEILNLAGEKVVVVHNGLSLESTVSDANISADKTNVAAPYIVSVGRLEYEKGFDLLIDAFEAVAEQLPHSLVIVGDGSQRKSLERKVELANLSGRVFFSGEQHNPYPTMKHGDFLVVPSRCEAFSYVVLESLALELPIISTDCEGPVNILANGEYGLLVKKSEVKGLAGAILQFATDPGLKDSFRVKSLSRAMEYSSDKMIREYETLFSN